jgi:hypothetical protein
LASGGRQATLLDEVGEFDKSDRGDQNWVTRCTGPIESSSGSGR